MARRPKNLAAGHPVAAPLPEDPADAATGWYFYLVRCGDGSLYAGITKDLARRIAQHNDGTGARYTRGRGPVRLEYREAFDDRAAASRRESEVKSWPRAAKEALIARCTTAPGTRRPGCKSAGDP